MNLFFISDGTVLENRYVYLCENSIVTDIAEKSTHSSIGVVMFDSVYERYQDLSQIFLKHYLVRVCLIPFINSDNDIYPQFRALCDDTVKYQYFAWLTPEHTVTGVPPDDVTPAMGIVTYISYDRCTVYQIPGLQRRLKKNE